MSELSHLAARAAVLQWLRDRVDGEYQHTRDVLSDSLDPNDRKSGMLGDESVGTVSWTKPRETATVTDEAALLAWVREHYPTEVETIEQVRPAFLSKLKADAKHYGTGVDESTGEIIPGLDVRVGEPGVMVRLSKTADDVITRHWHDVSRLVPELPDGAS